MRALVAISLLVAVFFCAGCGSDEPERADTATALKTGTTTAPGTSTAGGAGGAERTARAQASQGPEQAARAFIEAIDGREPEAVCSLLEPGSLDGLELPERADTCTDTIAGSLGGSQGEGMPRWRRTTIAVTQGVETDGDRSRVTLSVNHRFADRETVSVEDDVVYLRREGDGWLVRQPSATLYRAVGYPEPPLDAVRPPE
ncbi:MAG: hypothetical protein ACR2NA_12420 [Solirubrobacterales bacterium]